MTDAPKIMLVNIPGSSREPAEVFVYHGDRATMHRVSASSIGVMANIVATQIAPLEKPVMTLVDAPMGTREHFIDLIVGKVPNVRPVPTTHHVRVVPKAYR